MGWKKEGVSFSGLLDLLFVTVTICEHKMQRVGVTECRKYDFNNECLANSTWVVEPVKIIARNNIALAMST